MIRRQCPKSGEITDDLFIGERGDSLFIDERCGSSVDVLWPCKTFLGCLLVNER